MADDKKKDAAVKVGTILENGAQVRATCALCDERHVWTMQVADGDEVEVNCKRQVKQAYLRYEGEDAFAKTVATLPTFLLAVIA